MDNRASDNEVTAQVGTTATERRIVTVLFADLVGFTALSESLDPEDVAAVQDAYFAEVRATIDRHGGVLEKFIGDAAMAAFGLPRARDDDAERAVRAGLALVSAVGRLEAGLGLEPGALALRVGVNGGEVVHAVSGPDAGRVTGDTVNVAARLQAAAPPGRVLVGETAALAAEDAIELEPAVAIELKGKAGPVRARLAVGPRPVASRELALGRLRAPTIGREDELASLDAALEEAVKAGRAALRLVVAPPGVGKSRLLREWQERLGRRAAPPAAVSIARVRPDVLAPEPVVGELVRAVLGEDAPDPGTIAGRVAAAGVAAARADVIATELVAAGWPAAFTSAEADRDRRIAAWTDGLDALAGGPAAWLIEDVHWAGGDVLAFVLAFGSGSSRGGRLVVATARPSVLDRPGIAAPVSEPGTGPVESVMLGPLPPADAGSLVRALVSDALPASLVEEIARRSDGTPLFIEELLRAWAAIGVLVPDGDGWALTRAPEELRLPQSVHAIYAAQLDDLPATARSVAIRASVAGRRFPAGALPSLDVAAPEAGLSVLATRALVTGPAPDQAVGDAYAYRHALLRDAAYAGLARSERAELHVRLARWLTDAAADRREEVAELVGGHYAAALDSVPALATLVGGGLDRAATARLAAAWLEEAGEWAVRRAAYDAARTLAERAASLTPQPDLVDRARRLILWARIEAEAADLDVAVARMEEALTLLDGLLDAEPREEQVRSLYAAGAARLARALYQQIRFGDATRVAQTALDRLGEGDDGPTARLLVAHALGRQGDTNDGLPLVPQVDRALAIAERLGDAQLRYEALETRALLTTESGLGGERDWEEVAEAAAALENWDRHIAAKINVAAYLADDRAADMLALLPPLADLADAHGLRERRAWIGQAAAEASFVTGDWRAALEHGAATIATAEALGYHRAAVRTWFVTTPIALYRDDRAHLAHAARWFAERQSMFPDSPYGRLMHGAIDVRLAAAGLAEPPLLDPERYLPSLDLPADSASWMAAIESVVLEWLARGALDAVDAARARLAASRERAPATRLVAASAALIDAERHAVTDGAQAPAVVDAARAAVRDAAAIGAAWWLARGLRRLETAGAATAEEVATAASIEARLSA